MSPRAERSTSPLNIYHVLINGNNNESIFIDDDDKQMMVDILFEKSSDDAYDFYAYCILDNRANLLISPKKEELPNIMKKINTTYALYFNKKYQRCGHVFQDRYKSKAIRNDFEIKSVISYIHNNPVIEGICEHPKLYSYSSYNLYRKHAKSNERFITSDLFKFKEIALEDVLDFVHPFFDLSDAFYYDECYANIHKITKQSIQHFLRRNRLTIEKIKQKEYADYKETLVIMIRRNTGYSIRKISGLLGINRGEVYRIINQMENNNDLPKM